MVEQGKTQTLDDLYSEDTLNKARRLLRQGRVKRTSDPNVFMVQGNANYRVEVIDVSPEDWSGLEVMFTDGEQDAQLGDD